MILSIIYLRLHHLKLFSGIFLSLIGIIGLLILASLVKIPLVSLLPFISGYNFTHIMENMGFFICIIGGILIQVIISNLTNNDKTKLLYSRAISSSVIFFIFGIVILTNINKKIEHAYAWVSWGNLYQNTKNPIFKNLRQQISKNEQPSRVMSFHMHGTLLTAYGLETIAGYHPLTSELYSKLWFKMAEKWTQRPYWEDSFGKLTNFTFEAITSIFPATKNGLGLTRTHQKGEWILSDFANITLLSLMNAEFIVSKNKLLDQNLFELNTSPKSWDTLSQTEKIKTNLKANFTGEKPYYLYQNPNVLPRAFSVNTVKIFDTKEDILDALGTTDLKTLQKTVFIEKNHGLSELKKICPSTSLT